MPTTFISEKEKEGKANIWSCVELVTLLKIEDTIFSFKKTPQGTFVECMDQWTYALFCPAPQIFTLAPHCRFFPFPLPAPSHRKMLRPTHPWNSTSTVCITIPVTRVSDVLKGGRLYLTFSPPPSTSS